MSHRSRAGVHFPRHFIRAVLVAALVAPLPALASGTASAGGGGNTGYNAGKLVYATKLACDGCPFAGQSPAAAQLERLASDPAVAKALTASERELAAGYLKRRLKLN
jgi:hypothetical protein